MNLNLNFFRVKIHEHLRKLVFDLCVCEWMPDKRHIIGLTISSEVKYMYDSMLVHMDVLWQFTWKHIIHHHVKLWQLWSLNPHLLAILGPISQNLSSVTNYIFCYKLLKSLHSNWFSADLSMIVIIFHWKKALWNGFLVMILTMIQMI